MRAAPHWPNVAAPLLTSQAPRGRRPAAGHARHFRFIRDSSSRPRPAVAPGHRSTAAADADAVCRAVAAAARASRRRVRHAGGRRRGPGVAQSAVGDVALAGSGCRIAFPDLPGRRAWSRRTRVPPRRTAVVVRAAVAGRARAIARRARGGARRDTHTCWRRAGTGRARAGGAAEPQHRCARRGRQIDRAPGSDHSAGDQTQTKRCAGAGRTLATKGSGAAGARGHAAPRSADRNTAAPRPSGHARARTAPPQPVEPPKATVLQGDAPQRVEREIAPPVPTPVVPPRTDRCAAAADAAASAAAADRSHARARSPARADARADSASG